MDISFHYFAVKTLALKAGFDSQSAQKIAVFSQYIDDYNAFVYRSYTNIPDYLKNDKVYDVWISDSILNFNPATTGFVDFADLASLLLPRSQKYTVLPFHFIPKTVNDLYSGNLVTQEADINDGSIITECLKEARNQYQQAAAKDIQMDALMRIGLLLHTFADTCAHQKFSGILAENNNVTLKSVYDNKTNRDVTDKYQSYIELYLSNASKAVKSVFLRIGHGMLGHIPDFTHVTWSMTESNKRTVYQRNNTEAFISMCRKILNYLRSCRGNAPVNDTEWEVLSEKLNRAFLNDISNENEKNVFFRLYQIWTGIFSEYNGQYDYNADGVFPGALTYMLTPTEIEDNRFYLFVKYTEDLLIKLYGNRPRDDLSVVNEACEFNCGNPGENANAVCPSGLPVSSYVQINGHSDLSQMIMFNDNGCVYGIRLVFNPTSGSIYKYEIQVDASGPSGVGSGKGYLYFTDATGDTYSLSIYRSGRHKHVLDYNSRNPRITTITWSNKSR